MTWEKKRVLITVKTYPTKSSKHGDVVCVAGITDSGEWIRLYPFHYRYFCGDKAIKKYDWIEVNVQKAKEKLSRKESYKIQQDSVRVFDKSLSTQPINWTKRNEIILSKMNSSLSDLKNAFKKDRTSLGLIKPKEIKDFFKTKELKLYEKETRDFMFTFGGIRVPIIEKIPHIFKYTFTCQDGNEHNLQCEDWELLESYRSWGSYYNDINLLWEKLKERYYFDMIEKKDLYFYVGTYSQFPTWLIIGIYYPPKVIESESKNLTLNDFF